MRYGALMVCFLAALALPRETYAQKLVSCPNPLPGDEHCVKTGDVLSVTTNNDYPGGFNTLHMEDGSAIVVQGVSTWQPVIGAANIGKDVKIYLMGIDGHRGADGPDFHQGNEKPGYGEPGKPGRNGENGQHGISSPALYMYILQLRKIGDLEVVLTPGAGGDGGNGGRGQPGGDADCRWRGGDGGPGGLPGAGANGGSFGAVKIRAGVVRSARVLAAPAPKICETAICIVDPLTGKPPLKIAPEVNFPTVVVPPQERHGIWFSCLGKACGALEPFDNFGRGGIGGSWSEGGRGRDQCLGFYGVGGGNRGADNSHIRGANGRPSGGPLPILEMFEAK
jgi:hypothetical protein